MTIFENKRAQLKEISIATLLEESGPAQLVHYGIIAISSLLLFLVLWAGLTDIEEVARTFGEVIPYQNVYEVQYLEGGKIGEVLVEEGELVEKNQPLVTFDQQTLRTEWARAKTREANLTLNIVRLQSFLKREEPNTESWQQKLYNMGYDQILTTNEIILLVEDAKDLLEQQYFRRENELALISSKIEQRKEELNQLLDERETLGQNLLILEEEMAINEDLLKDQLVSKRDFLASKRQLYTVSGELTAIHSRIRRAEHVLAEAQARAAQMDADLDEAASLELNTFQGDLAVVRQTAGGLDRRLTNTALLASRAGIVKGLEVSAGNVMPAGGKLMELVPPDQKLLVETRIHPRDIGHVMVGDPVKVKALTYDFARYGSVAGHLKRISATTFEDEEGKPYYKAIVELASPFVGDNPNYPLRPGMTVEGDIILGEKSLLAYLLRPIRRAINSSFRER